MGRGYVRKTLKRSSDDIRKAVFAMANGSSLRQAARQFNIPRSTLLKHRRSNGIDANVKTHMAINDIIVAEKGRSTVSYF